MKNQQRDRRQNFRVVHLSTNDMDGGAARACFRLHTALSQEGIDSKMVVRSKQSDSSAVHGPSTYVDKTLRSVGPLLDRLPYKLGYDDTEGAFSSQWIPTRAIKRLERLKPDLVHLHWICDGFINIEALTSLSVPVVWTLHDMWPLTGGCHYSLGCTGYQHRCGGCPVLESEAERDLSRLNWRRKNSAWKDLDIELVAPSRWMARTAQKSSLFAQAPVKVIPHGLDIDTYAPIDKRVARRAFGLPEEAPILLFGAINPDGNPIKGFDLLKQAVDVLHRRETHPDLHLVVFGASEPSTSLDLKFPVHFLGRLHDDVALALAYSAADVMVVPSLVEAFGQTASEATACGTPVAAFETSGLRDVVDDRKTGYLAEPFQPPDLATGIAWCFEHHDALSKQAREKALRDFTFATYAQRHHQVYMDLLGARSSRRSS